MLGPVDLDDWLDEDEWRDILRAHPVIERLSRDSGCAAPRGWKSSDFDLARRLAGGEALHGEEIARLARLFGA